MKTIISFITTIYIILIKNNLSYITNENILNMNNIKKNNIKLYDYICDSIDVFCSEYYLNYNESLNDKKIVNKLLSTKTRDLTILLSLSKLERFIIKDLDDYPKIVYSSLLKYNHIEPTWNNILILYNNNYRDSLFSWIKDNISRLLERRRSFSNDKSTKDLFKEFILYLLPENEEIATEVIKNIYKPTYNSVVNIKTNQLSYLIENGLLECNKNIYNKLKEITNDILYKYIISLIKYTDSIRNIINKIEYKDILEAIKVSELDNTKKLEVIYDKYKKDKQTNKEFALEGFKIDINETFEKGREYEVKNEAYRDILNILKNEDILELKDTPNDNIIFVLKTLKVEDSTSLD